MKSKTPDGVTGPEDPRSGSSRLAGWLASANLLYVLPIMFAIAAVAFWRWSADEETQRIRVLTSEEISRVAGAVADRLQGHADVSVRSGNRWLLSAPRDQAEWDYDVFSRRWLNPELESVELVDAELQTYLWPSGQEPIVPTVVSPEDLALAVEEHRAVVVGPFFPPGRGPVSATIVPIERQGEATRWVVSLYDLRRVLRYTTQGAGGAFGIAASSDGAEIFTTHAGNSRVDEDWVRAVDLTYDRLRLELHAWPRATTVNTLRTHMPQVVLLGGLLAAAALTLGIRLAQVSGARAIEADMTASLQSEVRARKAAERSLERKLRELERSNEEFERFAYVISHDLRDPLNAIQLNVQSVLTQSDGELSDVDRTRLQQGVAGVSRLDSMIGRLLEYARAGGLAGSLELIDASEALDEAVDNLQALIETNGAEIERGKLPKVFAHRAALARLFQNLLANAIKYRDERTPVVHIEAAKGDEEWVFSVADNARGMDEEQIDHVFELFWRDADDRTIGDGIGLAVSKRIAEIHGGRMWVESEPGEGSTFFFSWPADPGAAAAQHGPTSRFSTR